MDPSLEGDCDDPEYDDCDADDDNDVVVGVVDYLEREGSFSDGLHIER